MSPISTSGDFVQVAKESGKKVIIVAGPNGSGKTTFAQEFLPHEGDCVHFVNVDLIASGLSPFLPNAAGLRAGRLMLEEIDNYTRRGMSFAFETTLSGRTYARRIREWKNAGYRVKLIFLELPTAEMAIERVATRVAQGGHSVPEFLIRRRFTNGKENFEQLYKPIVDCWVLYDNSGTRPRLIGSEGVM